MSAKSTTIKSPSEWTDADTQRAKDVWEAYQQTHDLTDRKGQTAGIDPRTGEVWIGESALDIVAERDAHGLGSPLFFVRIGYPTYLRKGGRR